MKLKNPLTIKRINRTSRTFTTKLYPLQYDYCIEMGLLSNKGIGRNRYRTEIKKIMKCKLELRVLTCLLGVLMKLGKEDLFCLKIKNEIE